MVETPGIGKEQPRVVILSGRSHPVGDLVVTGCREAVKAAGRTLVDASDVPELVEKAGSTAADYYRDRAAGKADAFITYRYSYSTFYPTNMSSLAVFLIDAQSGVIARAVQWHIGTSVEPRSVARRICGLLLSGEKK